MDAVPPQLVIDGLTAARDFMRLAQHQVSGGEAFGIVTWNYMPPAGATQVHPHMQVIVSRNPGNALRRSLASAASWRERTGRCYHAALVDTERGLGERWVGEAGTVAWLAPFTPTGLLGDLAAVFRERATVLDLSDADIADFAHSLVRILGALASRGLWSFNLCLMPAPFGAPPDRHCLPRSCCPGSTSTRRCTCRTSPTCTFCSKNGSRCSIRRKSRQRSARPSPGCAREREPHASAHTFPREAIWLLVALTIGWGVNWPVMKSC